MAQIKKRRAYPLTLGAKRPDANTRIYGPLVAFPSASGPASQVPPLASSLARPLAGSKSHAAPMALGPPLSIREVAALIGCSPWTVRQTLVPRGIPFFRSGASGRLIFYRDQIVRWIEQQQGGITTK
jgi:excisionase family DNA binding protein